MASYLPGLPTDSSPQNKSLYAPLAEVDPEVQNIIDKETWRQFSGLELIASEVSLSTLLFFSLSAAQLW